MKHLLIILSILLLSSFLISCVPSMVYLLTKETYVGERENGKYHGQGTLTLPDGDKYVGEWKDGEKHSQGTYTFIDGRQNIGEYKNDKEWNVKHYNTYGKYIGSWVNGVWQN